MTRPKIGREDWELLGCAVILGFVAVLLIAHWTGAL